MTPIRTDRTEGDYGAPLGHEKTIGSLPFYRENGLVWSIWELEDWERKAIANGANLRLGQMGEPIHPMSLGLDWATWKGEDEVSTSDT